ncbi:MAG: guanylate kinase [Actinomycetes bacterium]
MKPSLPSGSRVIVISGPGGVGKGTLVDQLLQRDQRLWLSRSWTTRRPRPGEAPDAYHFVSEAEFSDHVDAGGFLEWVEFLDYRQGSPIPTPPDGSDVLFEIDVAGARRVQEFFPDALLVFVDAPSRDVQAERMRGRGDAPERIAQRVEKADAEAAAAAELGMTVVVNDDFERAVSELTALIGAYRER